MFEFEWLVLAPDDPAGGQPAEDPSQSDPGGGETAPPDGFDWSQLPRDIDWSTAPEWLLDAFLRSPPADSRINSLASRRSAGIIRAQRGAASAKARKHSDLANGERLLQLAEENPAEALNQTIADTRQRVADLREEVERERMREEVEPEVLQTSVNEACREASVEIEKTIREMGLTPDERDTVWRSVRGVELNSMAEVANMTARTLKLIVNTYNQRTAEKRSSRAAGQAAQSARAKVASEVRVDPSAGREQPVGADWERFKDKGLNGTDADFEAAWAAIKHGNAPKPIASRSR